VPVAEEASQGACPWLRRNGLFREVIGYREAIALLNDRRLHVLDVFESLGIREEGRARGLQDASLLSTDGEVHQRIRSAVARLFTVNAVKRVRPYARTVATELVDAFAARGTCELVSEFALPYVQRTTGHYVGLPPDQIDGYWRGIEALATAKSRDDYERGGLLLADSAERALEHARLRPTGGVLGVLARDVESGSLSERHAIALIATLLSAGHEPTINQVALMVSLLSHHPDVWDATAAGDVDAAHVVESVLRFRATNQGVIRQVAEPMELHGVAFEAGESLVVNTGAANRDPQVFKDPDRFRVDADPSPHLAFGFGPHYCLGAALARVEIQEALLALVGRMSCPTVLTESVVDGGGLVGISSLVVSFSVRSSTR
jgi:cytochrome P450